MLILSFNDVKFVRHDLSFFVPVEIPNFICIFIKFNRHITIINLIKLLKLMKNLDRLKNFWIKEFQIGKFFLIYIWIVDTCAEFGSDLEEHKLSSLVILVTFNTQYFTRKTCFHIHQNHNISAQTANLKKWINVVLDLKVILNNLLLYFKWN